MEGCCQPERWNLEGHNPNRLLSLSKDVSDVNVQLRGERKEVGPSIWSKGSAAVEGGEKGKKLPNKRKRLRVKRKKLQKKGIRSSHLISADKRKGNSV